MCSTQSYVQVQNENRPVETSGKLSYIIMYYIQITCFDQEQNQHILTNFEYTESDYDVHYDRKHDYIGDSP